MRIRRLFLGLVVVLSCAAEGQLPERVGIFQKITVKREDGEFAVTHLEEGPSRVLLREPVRDIDHAIQLVSTSLSFVPPKRAGQYDRWVIFPRLDTAEDDSSFASGFAVRIGSRVLQRWNSDKSAEPVRGGEPISAGAPKDRSR